jgi:uncharacterized membrane protein (UPF0182 family)
MEPVFLAAEADAIPELRRFVVSDGRRVAMRETLAETIATLAGVDVPGAPGAEGGGALPEAAGAWPQAALDLLGRAESHLREGDWQGFGTALEELRALLQQLAGTGGGAGR